jgi:hypothetical protein
MPSTRSVNRLANALGVPAALMALLATDLTSLPPTEGNAFDQLARSLLALLAQAPPGKDQADLRF